METRERAATQEGLSIWREEKKGPRNPYAGLPLAEQRSLARRLNYADGLDELGLGIMCLAIGATLWLRGESGFRTVDLAYFALTAIPVVLGLFFTKVVRNRCVFPRIGSEKAVPTPYLFGLIGLAAGVVIAFTTFWSMRSMPLISQLVVLGLLPQSIADAIFVFRPRLFLYPIIFTTLLMINASAVYLLLIAGFAYVAMGAGAFASLMLNVEPQDGEGVLG